MEIKYQYLEDEYLLIQKFAGLFSLDNYLRFTRHLAKDLSTKTITKVLIDFRDLMFSENNETMPDDIDEKLDKISQIRRDFNQKQIENKEVVLVIWVDKPIPTVIAHLFVNNFAHMDYNYCSTLTTVIEILNLPSYSDNLESIVENLEDTFL